MPCADGKPQVFGPQPSPRKQHACWNFGNLGNFGNSGNEMN
jgi:hypothetical protein